MASYKESTPLPRVFTFSRPKANFPQTPSPFPHNTFQSLGHKMQRAAAFRLLCSPVYLNRLGLLQLLRFEKRKGECWKTYFDWEKFKNSQVPHMFGHLRSVARKLFKLNCEIPSRHELWNPGAVWHRISQG